MKHSTKYIAVENVLRALPRQGLSIVAVLFIGWFLRKQYRRDQGGQNYTVRAHKSYYVDPTNLYKYLGSYGNS